MGQSKSKEEKGISGTSRAEILPDTTYLGPLNCKSCWQKFDSLVKCHDHYLCRHCLNLLLTVSDRCPLCKYPLPTKLKISTAPSSPPPYEE
uniref:RING finger protein Z n=1 Tax=Mammarenavirus choriomeningitidis TaxID=3052303 RepID=C6YBC8_9VIRU|nr:Z protein [Mammarenavirus choriomeningitidis]